MRKLRSLMLLSGIIFLIFLTSCSKSGNTPIVPEVTDDDIPIISSVEENNREVLAVYDAVIDPIAKTFTVTPTQRTADFHVPLRYYFPNCLQIVRYTWTSYGLDAQIRLSHPLPQSSIDVFDPRVIAILPARDGVSMYYPIFNVLANNRVLMYYDGYTPLWDSIGGNIPGTNNPFLAYFRGEQYRRWSHDKPECTYTWPIILSGFGGPMVFKLVVDISTNFPAPSNPGIDNAPEPVDIKATIGPGLTESGGSALIEVTFRDWQGWENIKTKVECPALFDSAIQLFYSRPGQYNHQYIFSGIIPNSNIAPEGEYGLLIAAWDIPTQIHIYNEIKVRVEDDDVFNPVDVTPEHLNFSPANIWVEGDYAFVAGGYNGVHIFNVSDPTDPVWVKKVELAGSSINHVFISDGYGYFVNDRGVSREGLHILDVDPPEETHLVKSLDVTPYINGRIFVTGGYAYFSGTNSLLIIDVSPPESASVIKEVGSYWDPSSVWVSNGYAFVGEIKLRGIYVVDIEPPESANIVKSITSNICPSDVFVSGDYLYVTSGLWGSSIPFDYGLYIYDINPVESIYLVKSITKPTSGLTDLHVINGYAYCADGHTGLEIYDVDPVGSAYLVETVDTLETASGVFVKNDYAYVTTLGGGLFITDIQPPEEANIVGLIETPSYYAWGVAVSDDNAYITSYRGNIAVADIDPPEQTHIVRSVLTEDDPREIVISDGYAYVTVGNSGLQIIDIDPPENIHVVKTVDTPIRACDVEICSRGGISYAYVAGTGAGLCIIDLNPPESATLIKTVACSTQAGSVSSSNGYAYLTDYSDGCLRIIDVDPPESAYLVKTLELTDEKIEAVRAYNGYAFVLLLSYDDQLDDGFQVIDVDPPESAHVVRTVPSGYWTMNLFISDGYAFICERPEENSNNHGITIIDIEPPEFAYIETSFVFNNFRTDDVCVSGDYAYVSGCAGLHIVKLR